MASKKPDMFVGKRIGWARVLRATGTFLERRWANVTRDPEYDAQCVSCGAEHVVSRSTLYYLMARDKRGVASLCPSCSPLAKHGSHRGRSQNRSKCPKCAGMPWRRPEGKPCRCGGLYEPETIWIESIFPGSSPISRCAET